MNERRSSSPRPLTKLAWIGLAFAAAAAFAPVGDAAACGNEVEHRVDPRVAKVKRAEELVSQNDAARAFEAVRQMDREAHARKVGGSSISDRSLIVLARAAVRSEGKFFHGHENVEASTVEDRSKGIRWAADVFKQFHQRKVDDPVAKTDLAEALSLIGPEKAHALSLLEQLEKNDVVASAQGYAALARLRGEAGEGKPAVASGPLKALSSAKRSLALQRCAGMTKVKGLCEGTPSPKDGLAVR